MPFVLRFKNWKKKKKKKCCNSELQQIFNWQRKKKRFRNGLFQNHRHPSNILSENEKNVPNGKSCGISFQSGEMGSVKQ